MIDQLSDSQMQAVLEGQCYGHLGCMMDDGRPYVVPITYVYKDGIIFSFSFEGQKVETMRSNPDVCLQVQEFQDDSGWKSVIAWGEFQELSGSERDQALVHIFERLWWHGEMQEKNIFVPFRNSQKTMESALRDEGCILYAIDIEEMTGRYEKYE